jgi:hypothetical protein
LVIFDDGREARQPPSTHVRGPRFTSLPDTLLTAGALTRRHLTPIRAGWLRAVVTESCAAPGEVRPVSVPMIAV